MAIELVTPATARAAIAAHLLPDAADARLGEIVLATHQVAAVRRLRVLLATHGGALFADDVGLGKTFVALAVARTYARVTVIAPAALRAMWLAASARAHVTIGLTSYEALSRGVPGDRMDRREPAASDPSGAIVILDEAHRARNTLSRRYPRIAALVGGTHVLSLTATPVHNRLRDLRALVALFAGSRAWDMSEEELGAMVYRRRAGAVPVSLPRLSRPRWIELDDDSSCLEALLSLPPAVPPAGSGDGGVLLTLGLVRQWASSRAALVAALRRSLAKSLALGDAVATGHLPTREQLRTWRVVDDSMQLAFPEVLSPPVEDPIDRGALARALHLHANAASRLLAMLAGMPDPDEGRARHVAALQRVHPGERIVCFTEYAETAAAYWRHLRGHPGVARLSAQGGEIASGRISRDAVLQRFAPDGQRADRPAGVEAITTLITTDLLSEGVDLRDATVVVHLDLPWSPARLEQRVGRARRMGSLATSISVYAMHPPAAAETVLGLERRLREKTVIATRSVGSSVTVLPAIAAANPPSLLGAPAVPHAEAAGFSDAEQRSLVVDRVAGWSQRDDVEIPVRHTPVAAFVSAPTGGWLAAVDIGPECHLIASVGGQTGSDASLLTAACDLAEAKPHANAPRLGASPVNRGSLDGAITEALRLAAEQAATREVGSAGGGDGAATHTHSRTIRARALARIHRALLRAAPHEAPRMTGLAAAARAVVSRRLSAGTEMRLHDLMSTERDDASWLAAVGNIHHDTAAVPPPYELRAILVFVPTVPSRG